MENDNAERICYRNQYKQFWQGAARAGVVISTKSFKCDSHYQAIWATSCENVSLEIFDQVRFKPTCSATEIARILKLRIEQVYIILSKQRTTKVLLDCVNAQADLHFCCSHMAWHIFAWPGPNFYIYLQNHSAELVQLVENGPSNCPWPIST